MTAFDQGESVRISIVNQSTDPLDFDLAALTAALQKYVTQFVAPIWGCPAILDVAPAPVAGTWTLAFMDDADQPGALAYHDLSNGFPILKVFRRTIKAAKDTPASAASHELVEALVDPAINLQCVGPDGQTIYPYESADPVEGDVFMIDGFAVSNFVYPSWFEGFRKAGSAKFDQLGLLKAPFTIADGGYASVFQNGDWTNIYGSPAKKLAFEAEDRRGHRAEYRRAALPSWPFWRRLKSRLRIS